MKKALIVSTALLAFMALAAFRFQPQSPRTSALATAATASAICDATTDAAGFAFTGATSGLSCVNTGDIEIAGFQVVTIPWEYTRASGTALKMQCDVKNTASSRWLHVQDVDNSNASTTRTWTFTRSVSSAGSWSFDANADYVRCRFWIVGAAAGDKVKVAVVRVGSITRE
jgi:hypothetical protein